MEKGLAVVGTKPPESVIVYATEAGETADDGNGRNGVFTAALLRNIKRSEEFTAILREVNAEVRRETNQKQKPAKYDNLTAAVYLAGLQGGAGEASATAPSVTAATPAVTVTVTKSYGSLVVSASSAGTLYLDDAKVADLSAGDEASIDKVQVGDRNLELRHPDGQTEAQTATVSKGQSANVVFTYKPAPPKPAVSVVPAVFVFVPGGTFIMGSPLSEKGRKANEVQHQVTVSSFLISKYDVTFNEYDAYCMATGASHPSDAGWGRESRPVINVSWYDAVAYCNWRSTQEGLKPAYTINGTNVSWDLSASGYRLPTEAEWEYAAKASTSQDNTYWDEVYWLFAWSRYTSGSETHPVGQKKPNALGLYDMAGNVRQWCWDWYGEYSSGSQSDPSGPFSGILRVHRGGSWISDRDELRAAYHDGCDPLISNVITGFRLVCSQIGK
jgi:formylglycine-generating enzyme required for sulfatase activity